MAMDLISGRGLPPPDAGGGAPPPDLAALLGMGGGGPPGGGAPMAPPEAPPEEPAAPTSEVDAIRAILDAIETYKTIGSVDESERLIAEKMSTMAQQLLANNEKMADELTGGSSAMRKVLAPQ